MVLLIQYTLLFASVLLLVALGGCFSEHSGVINLGLEGIMVMGALGGALMMRYLPDGTPAALMVLLVILTSIIAGMLYSCLLAISAIIIYLCSFVLFFKTVMNRGIAKSEEKKARLEKQAALCANTEKGGDN